MKKTFQLRMPGKANQRVVESVQHEVNKYVKRERRKALPEGFDWWDFHCRVGPDQASAESRPLKEINPAIDQVGKAEGATVYVEVLAVPAHFVRAIPAAGTTPDESVAE